VPRTARPTGRPVIPVSVELSEDELIFFEDGRPPRSPVLMTFSEYDVGRMQAGYICLRCYEDLDTPFPDVCPIPECGYHMARDQAEAFAKEFKGTVHVGPSTSLAEERAIMNELREREARDAGVIWKPTILVPKGL